MKSTLIFLLACFVALSSLQAQFTITFDDHYPQIGDQVYYSFIVNETLDVMNGGADQIWDFSALDVGFQNVSDFVVPTQGQFSADYPNAEWLELSTGYYNGVYDATESYSFSDANGQQIVGQFLNGAVKASYINPRLGIPFPMSYGDVVSDNWTGEILNIGAGQTAMRSGQSVFEMDGYGTLILPWITLNDVVRVRSVVEYQDILQGFPVNYTDTILMWFSNDYNTYVAGYGKISSSTFPNLNATSITYIRNPDDIIIFPTLELTASESEICEFDCVAFTNLTDLSAYDDEDEISWQWTFPGGTPEFSTDFSPPNVCYDSVGVYEVTLEMTLNGDPYQKVFSEVITVEGGCAPVASFIHTPIVCRGQCYSFENTSENATEFFWTFQGATPSTSTDQNPVDICYLNQNGVFNVTLTATNESGTSVSTTQPVLVVNPPNVNAGPDQTIVQGTTTTVSVNAGNGTGQVIWQPYEDVNCFSCASTTTYPLEETTTFIVYYQQAGGCQSSDTLTVFVEEAFGFGIPNTFSPNGDGANDILYVRGSNITRMNFQIYNRYGQRVFETSSQSVGWDGTQNGRDINPGVFGYILEVSQLDGTNKVVKGDITLVR
jgi:gliding motility-associated-like protein